MKVHLGPFPKNSNKERKIKIQIDRWDTWSTDHTLSLIIHPLLVQLQKTKHGSPFVDDEDVPEELKSTSAPVKENEWDTDDNFHQRWEYVLGEMIWAFEQHNDDDADRQFHSGDHDLYWQKVDAEGNEIDSELYKIGDNKGDSDENTLWQMVKGPNDTHVFDREGWEAWSARKQNGFRLFGKYFQSLWD